MSVKDSATLEAICALSDQTGADGSEMMQTYTSYLLGSSVIVTLNHPCTVTTKSKSGVFGRQPLIGEEQFQFTGAYMGKRDGVILQARGYGPSPDPLLYEFPASVAESGLDGYRWIMESFIKSYGLTDDAADTDIARVKATIIEAAAHEKAQLEARFEDKRFGSW